MIRVNEIFGPTIQGEGRSTGKEVMFLRLSGCNLHCVWCDTPHTWNWIGTPFLHPEKYSKEEEEHKMETNDLWERLRTSPVKSIVISGGEPLIQQKQLLPIIYYMKMDDWWVEVETNGTVPLRPEFEGSVDQINCSPKLSNSGDPLKARIREEALRSLAKSEKVWFKFVVGSEQDAEEVMKLVEQFDLTRVYLMPLGKTVVELEQTTELAKRLASENNLLFSPRLHITQLGGGRGV